MTKATAPKKITITQTRPPAHKALLGKLDDLFYKRVTMVMEQGEYAVRGSIIDIFPVNHTSPVRLDYLGNDLERLNTFNIATQKSLDAVKSVKLESARDSSKYSVLERQKETIDKSVISDIQIGDYVVHEDYGIGIFKGLEKRQFGDREGEYVFIEYRATDKLYVPLEQIHLLHRYSGGDSKAKVNALYDGSWQRIKQKTKKALRELAVEVYEMIKKRQAVKGTAFTEDSEYQLDFDNAAGFELTLHQAEAWEAIKGNMEADTPMDRLICGDVGFGKTELLMRAAFKAVESQKQVAILVPTTILAEQHLRTFRKRFDPYPYRIEGMSRLKSDSQCRTIIKDIKTQKVDIVIGTHKLLQKSIEYADLGLLMVDEEQRFGVSHKERIKQIKANVDVLTTTATPIPRTLYMALTGAKEFSVLKTPPPNRKPIQTIVAERHEDLIKEAINQEFDRNGQIYYLYNVVRGLPAKEKEIKRLFPNARIGIAHGQMTPEALDTVMVAFYKHEIDILLCTTIIENGLDISNVNTVIIDRAEYLGLSQIHQIRGRVGRSSKQAYAYVFYSNEQALSEKAQKRLQAVKEAVTLGAGYQLAMKDLEIRGAGTLLGEKQHGHMTAIGFDLYCKLLEESVLRVKHEGRPPRKPSILINASLKAYIPESYIENPRERLAMYQRLTSLETKDQSEDLLWELRDRYGEPPLIVTNLLKAIIAQLA
ncbi:transcription-repair coupling factor [bacterium]|jgi:transcription-repair coupling factor (superfamily II helicase)|nr:transcription-repair coupling factor [bacterium]